MFAQTPALLAVWEIAVEASGKGTEIDVAALAEEIAAKYPSCGLSASEISDLLARAAQKRGVPARCGVEHLAA